MAFELSDAGELVYRLAADEELDRDAYEMLRHNDAPHILSPQLSQADDERVLRYGVTQARAASGLLAGRALGRDRYVALLSDVTDAFVDAQGYMLSDSAFAASLDYLYLDEQMRARLTYVPVAGFVGCAGAQAFLAALRASVAAEQAGDLAYLARIDEALARQEGFTPEGFKRTLASLAVRRRPAGAVRRAPVRQEQPARARLPERADDPGARQAPVAGGARGAITTGGMSLRTDPAGGGPKTYGGMVIPGGTTFGGGMGATGDAGIPAGGEQDARGGLLGGLFGKGGQKEDRPKRGRRRRRADADAAAGEPPASKGEASRGLFGRRQRDEGVVIARGEDHTAGSLAIPGREGTDTGTGGPRRAVMLADPPASGDQGGRRGPEQGAQSDITEVFGVSAGSTPVAAAGGEGEARRSVTTPAYLQREGTAERRRVDVTPFRIGRRERLVDFYIPDEALVSRLHAILTCDGGRFFVQDNASRNGTFVNGARLEPGSVRELADGDRIGLGDETLRFSLG